MLERFIQHLAAEGYHPRSDKHSNALAEQIVLDLLDSCIVLNEKARKGELVYSLNFSLMVGTIDWNVDLVLGAPSPGTSPPAGGVPIIRSRPSLVEIAIEIKSVMTEHRKAVKNRKRDFEAHHEHVHNYNEQTIAGGVLVLNAAETFKSPLRQAATSHKNVRKLMEHCLNELKSVKTRSKAGDAGLDAKCGIVIQCSNLDEACSIVVSQPAPQVGEPIHYHAFLQNICRQYRDRFGI